MGLADWILRAVDADYANGMAKHELGWRAAEEMRHERDYGAKRMVDVRLSQRNHDNRSDGFPNGDRPTGGWFW